MQFADLMPVDMARDKIRDLGLKEVKTSIHDLPAKVLDDGSIAMSLDGGILPLTRFAATQVANLSGLKKQSFQDYVDNADIVTKMLRHSLGKRTGDVFVSYNRDAVYHVQSDVAVHINPSEVFDLAVEALSQAKKEARVDTIRFDKGVLTTRFVTDVHQNPTRRVGDVSHGGVVVGVNGQISVAPYLYRLVCTNGAVRCTSYPDMSKDAATVKGYVQSTVQQLMEVAQRDLDLFMSMDNEFIDNPAHLFNRVTRESGVSDRHSRLIGDAIPSMERVGDNHTRYDMVNLVSALANSTGDLHFQYYAGAFLDAFIQHRCGSCGSRLVG